jgi:Swt1-like HEPN
MTVQDARGVIGFQNGLDVAKWLDPDALVRVGGYVKQLNDASRSAASPRTRSTRAPARVVPNDVIVTISGVNVGKIPGLKPAHAKDAKRMAERVYPLIYLFENSARDVITRVLRAALGDNWWLQVPTEVSNQATLNMNKAGEEAWHSTRADPIQCIDLPQLKNIVKDDKLWPHFKPLFNRKSWFESVVDDVNVSRRVVAHMNPLTGDDIKSIETGFRKWVKQLQANEASIP